MEKSVVIYGPPGCGKSTEILRRMREAIKAGVQPDRIGLVSFTRAAAHELARRVGVRPGRNISTIHSYAFRLTNMVREQVVNREKLREFSRESKIETTGAGVYDQEVLGPGDYYLAMYGYMRSLLWDDPKRAFYEGGREGSLAEFKYFIQAYEQWKEANGFIDFSDMLTNALREDPKDLGLDVLFLDEAQDFSLAQWKLIHHWVPHVREVVLALDDDQTLYKFNGAYPDGGAKFEKQYGSERVVLRQSYRVPSSVHALATNLISHIADRVEKEYLPREEVGHVRRFSDLAHVPDPEPAQETLILFRNHAMRGAIEDWLMGQGVPYLTDNGRPGPLQGGFAAAIRAWEQAQSAYRATGNPMVEPRGWSVMRRHALAVHARHFKAEQIEPIIEKPWQHVFNFPRDIKTYLQTLEAKYGMAFPKTKIHLSTIHGAKGREADRVILLDGMSDRVAESMTRDPDTEIRTFYVGVTRTRKELDIVTADNPISTVYMRARAQEQDSWI